MTGPDTFLSRLRPGERVLWNAPASAAVRDAAHRHSQRMTLLTSVVCAASGSFMAWKAYESVMRLLTRSSTASASDTLIWAVALTVADALFWGALAVLTLRIGVASAQHYFLTGAVHRKTSAWTSHYVLTDQRVFCIDENGDLTDEIEGRDVVAVTLEEKPRPPTVLVEDRTGDDEDKYFLLTNLEHPQIAKTKIEETFLEPTP